MVSVGDFGVLFKTHNGADWTRYVCDPDAPPSFTTTTPTYTDDDGNAGTYFATTDRTSKTMIQVREDPENYVEGTV